MLGYGKYWTGGVSAAAWEAVFNPKKYNWVDFTFISVWLDYDRKMNDLTFEVFLFNVRFWLCIRWADPDPEVLEAIKSVELP